MDRMSSIELALKNEKTEMEFYLNESRRSKNPLATAMFQTLARDEKEHMTRIQGLHEKLLAGGGWPRDVRIEVAGTDIREVLDGLVSKTGSAESHDDDDIQALENAGVQILSCGTCLDYFGLKEKLKVGKPTNMKDTVATLMTADRVVCP